MIVDDQVDGYAMEIYIHSVCVFHSVRPSVSDVLSTQEYMEIDM